MANAAEAKKQMSQKFAKQCAAYELSAASHYLADRVFKQKDEVKASTASP